MAQLFSLGHFAHFMKTTEISTDKRDSWALSFTAFILFLVGLFLPFISMAVRRPDALLIAAAAAMILALIFGIMTWRQRLGKIATIGAAVLCLISVINLILFSLIR